MSATSTPTSTSYNQLLRFARDAGLIGSTAALLGWDQEVIMPSGGVAYRSEQLAHLARMRHQMITNPQVGALLSACEADNDLTSDPRSPSSVNIRELRREYNRSTKLPPDLVHEEARLASVGQHIWQAARRDSDFGQFRPHLARIVDLLRRKADCYGWPDEGEAWDALAEDYEPGSSAAAIAEVFTPLRDRLQTLIHAIVGSERTPSTAFIERAFPLEKQKPFMRVVSERIGFDFERGRLDVSTHPFCSGTHCNDVRMTTRYDENDISYALTSMMHESGHGIYEQGLQFEHVGTPMGHAVSLGIHESQSRLWENQVGRSMPFCRWLHGALNDSFGAVADGLTVDDLHAGLNVVSPSFIRTEADEATYNMHIFIRFELERAMLSGNLDVADLPEAWNARYKEYLGIDVPDDARGCLQDIHWSSAAMGYFPTYTLGNLYGAQFFEKALEDMPNLYAGFEKGEFGDLKTWLNENIHVHGRRYRAADLCEVVTGKPLSADPLLRHLEGKLRPLYGI